MNDVFEKIACDYLADVRKKFAGYRKLAERAMAQVDDEGFFSDSESESNSIAIIVKHISGNQRSRWTDFLTTDGEKPDRHRDTEFELASEDREGLMKRWENGWTTLLDTLEELSPEDLAKTVYIRAEPHSVVNAINRQLAHYSFHIGQIVIRAKDLAGNDWESLSVPKGGSVEFNREMFAKNSGS